MNHKEFHKAYIAAQWPLAEVIGSAAKVLDDLHDVRLKLSNAIR